MLIIDGCNLLGWKGSPLHTFSSQYALIEELNLFIQALMERGRKREKVILLFDSHKTLRKIHKWVEVRYTLNADREIIDMVRRVRDKSGIRVVTNDRGIIDLLKGFRALRFLDCEAFLGIVKRETGKGDA